MTLSVVEGRVLAAPGDVPVCDPRTENDCMLPTQQKYVLDNEEEKCNCSRQCHRLIYQVTVSQALLATSVAEYFRDFYDPPATVDDVITNHCIVEVRIYQPAASYSPPGRRAICVLLVFCSLYTFSGLNSRQVGAKSLLN